MVISGWGRGRVAMERERAPQFRFVPPLIHGPILQQNRCGNNSIAVASGTIRLLSLLLKTNSRHFSEYFSYATLSFTSNQPLQYVCACERILPVVMLEPLLSTLLVFVKLLISISMYIMRYVCSAL